jgi:hypothetical protein
MSRTAGPPTTRPTGRPERAVVGTATAARARETGKQDPHNGDTHSDSLVIYRYGIG